MTLQRALIGSLILAILVGTVPAGIALRARLSSELLANARRDLALAPRVLIDRSTALGDALMMHAKDLAHDSRLIDALARRDREAAMRVLQSQTDPMVDGIPVLVGPDGKTWSGPAPSPAFVAAAKGDKMPVDVGIDQSNVLYVSLAEVAKGGTRVGVAGFALPMDEDAARVLAGLTRANVVILAQSPQRATATTLDSARTEAVARAVFAASELKASPHEIESGADRLLLTWAPLGTGAAVAFVRIVGEELAVVPSVVRLAATFAIASLTAALLLGAWLTTQVTKPVRQLSRAAKAFGAGTGDAPLPASRLEDIAVVSRTFAEMRDALAARLAELERANRSLSEHATRLAALQNDLVQRERLDAVNRMVVQLAHELRNPIASLRNLLELINRRTASDEQTNRYAEIAIDELLRMHELAERMLDLNRPSGRSAEPCDACAIATDVARLSMLGISNSITVSVLGDPGAMADIGADPLRRVLVNLVQNACEAIRGADVPNGRVTIDIARNNGRITLTTRDNGPGIAPEVLPRVFDPFVTTKQQVHGVGLGLYIAETIVRSAGGTISAQNEAEGGASFIVVVPAAAQLHA